MIELINVSKKYNDRYVLKDVSLSLPRYGLVIINGPSGCGKTTLLLQVAHNYEERDQKVLLFKPLIDTKGGDEVVSRLGAKRKVDHLLSKEDKISASFCTEFIFSAAEVEFSGISFKT